ncbi:MAG TPA: 2OG-Fe(II) oxygenase, partial [Burkholderiaceae bacterium]
MLANDLDERGWAIVPRVLGRDDCERLRAMYANDAVFRSRVVMQRHGFGQGEYQYFGYPLLERVAQLRATLYPRLVAVANRWHERMGLATRFPSTHAEFLARCHGAGQTRPTPLLLRYRAGDYNCLHQDVYGEHVFPLQAVVLLSRPGIEFDGGELVLTEQRPRMQSRASVLP